MMRIKNLNGGRDFIESVNIRNINIKGFMYFVGGMQLNYV